MKAALYIRCSKPDAAELQNPKVQEGPLRDLARQRGWEIFEVYADQASGAKEDREGLKRLLADARRGAFQVVMVWRFDRFARTVRQLVLALEEFQALGIDFVSHQESLDTSTPMGKAVFTIIAAMAELERSVLRDRVRAGLAYARTNGTRSGKEIGRPRRIFRRDEVRQLRDEGKLSWNQIAELLGVGRGTVERAYRASLRPAQPSQNPTP